MSINELTGKIMQNRNTDKIQYQTSFTDFPVFILYCKCIEKNKGIPARDINGVLGTERNKNGSWNQTYDSHARISLAQYNLIKLDEHNNYVLDSIGQKLVSLFDDEFNLIGTREDYMSLTYDMITSWVQNKDDFNIHPGLIILKLMLEPSLHGYVTSQDIAHIFNYQNNKNDNQYNDIVRQIIEFRNSGKVYSHEELKKTYTLLTGYVNWDIFDLDSKNSNSTIKVVYMKEDFRKYASQRLRKTEEQVLSTTEFKELVVETENIKEKIEHLTEKYGEKGRIIVELETRIAQVQNAFRNRLIKEFGQKCMMCDITHKELLVASHIKRDADCDTIDEKIDNNNGFLLCAIHDKLFDRFLISFDGLTGKIMISSHLSKTEKELCHIDENYILSKELLTPERQLYLIWHNSEFVKKENGD